MKPWSADIWRIIALWSVGASVVLSAGLVYFFFAFRSNLGVILDGAPLCLAKARSFDSIAAAQAVGRLDLVSFLLTMGGLFIAVFSLFGFWIIRREALEEAREAAIEEVRRIGPLYGLAKNGNGTHMGHESGAYLDGDTKSHEVDASVPQPSEVPTAGAQRETSGGSS